MFCFVKLVALPCDPWCLMTSPSMNCKQLVSCVSVFAILFQYFNTVLKKLPKKICYFALWCKPGLLFFDHQKSDFVFI